MRFTNEQHSRIKRVGVVVEMQDGSRTMFFSDDPGAEIALTSEREMGEIFYDYPMRAQALNSLTHTIEIRNIRTYTMRYPDPKQTAEAIDGIKNAIGQTAHKEG